MKKWVFEIISSFRACNLEGAEECTENTLKWESKTGESEWNSFFLWKALQQYIVTTSKLTYFTHRKTHLIKGERLSNFFGLNRLGLFEVNFLPSTDKLVSFVRDANFLTSPINAILLKVKFSSSSPWQHKRPKKKSQVLLSDRWYV